MTDPEKPPTHQYADSGEASHIYLLPNSLTAGNLFFWIFSYYALH